MLLYFRQEHGKIQKEGQTLNAVDFDPRQPNNKTVNQESLDKLTQALILANPTCGFVKYNTESGNTDSFIDNQIALTSIINQHKIS